MAINEHKNLLDANRHNPKGYEGADNNSFLGKGEGSLYDDKLGGLSWNRAYQCKILATATISTTLSVTASVDYIRIPYAFRLTDVRASLFSVADAVVTVDIKEGGVSVLSTLITIDAAEKTSTTAATPAVISDTDLADDSEITIDITTIGGGGNEGEGLKVYLIGYRINN